MTQIKNLSTFQSNVGGITRLFVISCRFITAGLFQRPNSYFDINYIAEQNAGFEDNLIEIIFSEQTAFFKEVPEKADLGLIYKQSIECIVAKDYIERNAIFNDIASGPVIAFAFDTNNVCHVLGTVNIDGSPSGADFLVSSETGTTYDSLNNRKINIVCESSYPAPNLGTNGNEYFEIQNPDELE